MSSLILDKSFIKFKEETMFQKLYDWIKSIKTPKWLVELLQFVQDNILIPTLKSIGETAIHDLRNLILEASKKDMTGRQKIEWVKNGWLEICNFENISDHAINLVIEHIVSEIKKKNTYHNRS